MKPPGEFYTQMGYGMEATIKDFYGEGDDLAILVKRLKPDMKN